MFPATGTTKADNLSEAWTRARGIAQQVRMSAASLSASAAGASTSAEDVLNFTTALADLRSELDKASKVAGIGAYAQAQLNDATVNVGAEFSAMMSAIDAVTAAVLANFPKDAQGRLLFRTFSADNSGRYVSSTFTSAQMAAVKSALDALVATISA